MSSPLAGAWEYVSETHQGFWVCTETHYSIVLMRKNRQRIARELTPDEALEIYQSVNAVSGTYTLSGSRLTLKKIASLRADVLDVDVEAEFTIDGDRMTLRTMSGTSRPRHEVWRKVS